MTEEPHGINRVPGLQDVLELIMEKSVEHRVQRFPELPATVQQEILAFAAFVLPPGLWAKIMERMSKPT